MRRYAKRWHQVRTAASEAGGEEKALEMSARQSVQFTCG
jgi:hypothetical protein